MSGIHQPDVVQPIEYCLCVPNCKEKGESNVGCEPPKIYCVRRLMQGYYHYRTPKQVVYKLWPSRGMEFIATILIES
jgi:hypothetical protein